MKKLKEPFVKGQQEGAKLGGGRIGRAPVDREALRGGRESSRAGRVSAVRAQMEAGRVKAHDLRSLAARLETLARICPEAAQRVRLASPLESLLPEAQKRACRDR